jgi:hypothetical protein
MTINNTYPAKNDLQATEGDTIAMNFQVNRVIDSSNNQKFYINCFSIPHHGTAFHMDSLKMQIRRKDGVLLKEWLSASSPAEITINPIADGEFNISDSGFSESGFFDYDLQCENGTDIFTIMKGTFLINKKI